MVYLFALTIILAPLYVWRFAISGAPLNFLMVWLAFVTGAALIWIIYKGELMQFIRYTILRDKILFVLVMLLFLASCVGLVSNGFSIDRAGQWIVLYAEPIALFFVLRYIAANNPQAHRAVKYAMYLFLAACGILALAQYSFLIGLPSDWWGNANEPKRAIAFFAHPNGLALFLAPLLAFLTPDLFTKLEQRSWRAKETLLTLTAWLLGAIALFLSLSRGGWLGFGIAAVIYAVFVASRKYLKPTLVILAILAVLVVAVPNLRYRIILPFYGEKSAAARISLWHTGEAMIRDNPIFGKGVAGFGINWDKYNTDPNLDHYNSPHNIFLNFWIDVGLLGLLSFLALLVYGLVEGLRHRRDIWKIGLALFIIAIFFHGLIDTPYLKNDLALEFWIIFALAFI